MANSKPIFRVLDDGTDNGAALSQAVDATTAAAALLGSVGFAFKDSSGNVVLPQLTADGKIPVTDSAVGGTCLTDHGTNAGSLTYVTLATITGALAKSYTRFGINVSCFRDTEFELVYVDDAAGTPAETILGTFRVGAGQYTYCCELSCIVIDTTGGTGTQEFRIRGINIQKASDMEATLAVTEN